jgi:hypothetical protein
MKGKVNSRSDIGISRRYFMLDWYNAPLIFSEHYKSISGFTNFMQTAKSYKYP